MVNFGESELKLALLCVAGIILNLLGAAIVEIFYLPLYLDTTGTIFIAALGGYLPGIAVGFLTNLLGTLINNSDIYYNTVSVLLAAMTAFFVGRGYYEKFPRVLLIIPATVFMTTAVSVTIEELLNYSLTIKFEWTSVTGMLEHFLKNFSNEMPDKFISIMLAFFALKLIPSETRRKFRRLGKMQSPVSDKMHREMKTSSRFISSLRTKMVFNLMSITVFVAVLISAISYVLYQNNFIRDRIQTADWVISSVVNEINPRRVNDFLTNGRQAEGYREVEQKLYKIRNSNRDIRFIYVYKILEDGCHVVFDLDTALVKGLEPGDVQEFDESFKMLLPDLLAGRPIDPIITNDTFGHLLTIYKPVYDTEGHCVCYAGIDFSMDQINDYGRLFIVRSITIFGGAVIFIFVLAMWFIENNIILPVNTMAYCARNFAYDSEEAREQNIERLRNLNIKTHDEIENLYAAFLKTTSDSMHYFENLKRSKIQLAVMDELAHKDALTGLKNKAAYNEYTAKLDADIIAGRAEFAIAMIDVNYLKRVNDTYGHERGNEYLINAAKLVCKIFGEERVYRIGGDEFVAILDGNNFARTDEFVDKIRAEIEKLRADSTLEPWEKVSAAVGVSYYTAGDSNADEVFKRADADMYQKKLAMKAVRKD